MNDTKTCLTCNETKPMTDFHKDAAMPDGRKKHCKVCRGVASPLDKREKVGIRPELKVWMEEFHRNVPCALCGSEASLSAETVEEARDALRTAPPRCGACESVNSTKFKLKARRWPELVDQLVATIDLHHDTTVAYKNFKHERAFNDDSRRWLAGQRDDCSDDLLDQVADRWTDSLDWNTKHETNERYPIITRERARVIEQMEIHASAFNACENDDDDDPFNIMEHGNLIC